MALSLLYKTITMMQGFTQQERITTFLRDRYFPTDQTMDVFKTEDVLMDIRDGALKMAPVVLPRKKGITVAREGYRTQRMTPPFIAPQRPLTLDDLNSRGFGEALHSDLTTDEREAALLGRDLNELDLMHNHREEYIAAQCMLNNGYTLRQYADGWGTDENEPYEIRFYEGDANPSIFTPGTPWNEAGANIYGDLTLMVSTFAQNSRPVSDFIGAADVMAAVLSDETIAKMLDNRRIHIGEIEPMTLPDGASLYARLNVGGHTINLIAYEAVYIDDVTGVAAPLFKSGEAVMTAPNAGRGLYGAVTQLEEEDRQFHTYGGRRIPKYMSNVEGDIRTIRVASRPLFVPRYVNPWLSTNVFA